MEVYAWLIDFAHFRKNCPTGIIPEWLNITGQDRTLTLHTFFGCGRGGRSVPPPGVFFAIGWCNCFPGEENEEKVETRSVFLRGKTYQGKGLIEQADFFRNLVWFELGLLPQAHQVIQNFLPDEIFMRWPAAVAVFFHLLGVHAEGRVIREDQSHGVGIFTVPCVQKTIFLREKKRKKLSEKKNSQKKFFSKKKSPKKFFSKKKSPKKFFSKKNDTKKFNFQFWMIQVTGKKHSTVLPS